MILILSSLASNLESNSDYYKFMLEYKGGHDEYLDIIEKALSATSKIADKEYVRKQLLDSCLFCKDGRSLYDSFIYDIESIVYEIARLTRDIICPDILNIKIVNNSIYVSLSDFNRARSYSNINKLKKYMYHELRNKNRYRGS